MKSIGSSITRSDERYMNSAIRVGRPFRERSALRASEQGVQPTVWMRFTHLDGRRVKYVKGDVK